MAVMQDPLPGYYDSMLGLLGPIIGMITGVLRVAHAKEETLVDIIPVDYAINSMLAIVWSKSMRLTNGTDIYNCVNGNVRKISAGSHVTT